MATNQILSLGIPSNRVGLVAVLKELRNSAAKVVVADVIAEVTQSIMFDALGAYRNWVTHRGAPRIVADAGTQGADGTTTTLDEWIVTCYPFVPPVFRKRLTAPTQIPALKAPRRVVMADGQVAYLMFEPVILHAGRLTLGDLDRDADEYVEKNPEQLELGRVRVGGEELAQYTAREFIRAVHGLVWTLTKALSFDSAWDSELTKAAGLPSAASDHE